MGFTAVAGLLRVGGRLCTGQLVLGIAGRAGVGMQRGGGEVRDEVVVEASLLK